MAEPGKLIPDHINPPPPQAGVATLSKVVRTVPCAAPRHIDPLRAMGSVPPSHRLLRA